MLSVSLCPFFQFPCLPCMLSSFPLYIMHYPFRSLHVSRLFSIFFMGLLMRPFFYFAACFVRVLRNPLNNSSRFHSSSLALVLFYFSYPPPLFSSSSFFIGIARAKSLPPSFLRSLWVYLQLLFAKLGLCLWASLLVLFVPARFFTSRVWACGLVFENLLCLRACLRSCFIVHAGFIRKIYCARWELRRIYCTCIFDYII